MKRLLYSVLVLCCTIAFSFSGINAQNVAINSTGNPPDGSAMLDVSSSNSGILIPRMNQSQRNSISSPATGLLVYQTDNTPGFYYYNGSTWVDIRPLSGYGSATRVAFWSGSSTLSSNSNLYWNNSANRLGIGTSSPLETLHVNGSVRGNQSGALRISTGYGYIDIGPKNSSWSHFNTDRPRYYFDKGLTVDQGLIGSYDENLYLQTAGTTRITALTANGYVGIGTTAPSQRLDVIGYVEMSNGYAVGTGATNVKMTYGRINYGSIANGDRDWAVIPHGLSSVSQILVSLYGCSNTSYQVHPSGVQVCTFVNSGEWNYCIENKSGETKNVQIVWMAIGTP